MICVYNTNLKKRDLKIYDETKDLYIFDNNLNKNIIKKIKIIPFIKGNPHFEICCLESAYLYFKNQKSREGRINFQIKNPNKKTEILQLYCINSFKKRKLIKSKLSLKVDPENFTIDIQDINKIINLFEFFKKTNFFDLKKYFFGFLINYYFYLYPTIEKE